MLNQKRTLIAVGLLTLSVVATANEYPNRPITIVVPYVAGGTSDAQVRMFQGALSKALGQPIIVENKPGASGAIGALQVARSKPDGYTLLYPNTGLVSAPLLNKKAGYEALTDFKPVGQVSAVPMVLVTNKQIPATDTGSFIAYARKQKEELMYASAGAGSFGHLSSLQLAQQGKFKALHIPYKGEAATTMALRSGEVQMLLTTPSSSMLGQIKEGNLRLLGVGSALPSPVMPDVPTLNQTLPGFVSEIWFGLLAPAGTPDIVINKLNQTLNEVLKSPEIQKQLMTTGAIPRTSTPDEFGQLLQKDHAQLQSLITQFNITIE